MNVELRISVEPPGVGAAVRAVQCSQRTTPWIIIAEWQVTRRVTMVRRSGAVA